MKRKKEALTEFNRENILVAAEELFLLKGVQNSTMDDIAKLADYSKSTIYSYFKSKDEIYDYILLKSIKLLGEQLTTAIENSQTYEQKYFALCNALFDYAEKYPLYFESLLQKIDCTNELLFAAGEKINAIIGSLMQSGIEEGYIRTDLQFPTIILTMWSSVSGLIRMSATKADYIEKITGKSPNDFAHIGFETLLRCIKA
jgi:AcrR family transcriptional regulator